MKKYRVETDELSIPKGTEIESIEAHKQYITYSPTSNKFTAGLAWLDSRPHWFSPVEEEVKEGQYWRLGTQIVRVYDVDNNGVKYGYIGKHQSNDKHWYRKTDFPKECSKLDTDSISEHLIAEAKRRGFEADVNAKCLVADRSEKLKDISPRYYKDEDRLVWRSDSLSIGCVIYKQGKWASIVDEPIQINGYEAEFKDGYVQFGCAKIDNKVFTRIEKLQSIVSTGQGNRKLTGIKIGKGLFTIEDIKKIAKRIKDEDKQHSLGFYHIRDIPSISPVFAF